MTALLPQPVGDSLVCQTQVKLLAFFLSGVFSGKSQKFTNLHET